RPLRSPGRILGPARRSKRLLDDPPRRLVEPVRRSVVLVDACDGVRLAGIRDDAVRDRAAVPAQADGSLARSSAGLRDDGAAALGGAHPLAGYGAPRRGRQPRLGVLSVLQSRKPSGLCARATELLKPNVTA